MKPAILPFPFNKNSKNSPIGGLFLDALKTDNFLYLNSLIMANRDNDPLAKKYTLDRVRLILDLLDRPERTTPIIHVAGSKGKGSVCAYLAATLEAMGYKTTLFTSPHILDVRERITMRDAFLPLSLWKTLQKRVETVCQAHKLLPTYFEALTIMVFLAAQESRADWLVLETGIGGRLDCTNVCTPMASVITPIELEHTQILGDTIPLIASEKAGIIKNDIPVFSSRQTAEAVETLKEKARLEDAPFFYLPDSIKDLHTEYSTSKDPAHVAFHYQGRVIEARAAMLGEKQVENAALAYLTLDKLFPGEALRMETAWRHAVETVRLPVRMELFNEDPLIFLDGGHTKESFKNAVETFSQFVQAEDATLIFGCAADKQARAMALLFAPFKRVIITTPGTAKSDVPALYALVKTLYAGAELIENPLDAIRSARREGRPVLVAGSFYLAAAIKEGEK